MKKVLAMLLVLCMVMGTMVGCGAKTSTTESATEAPAETTEAETTDASAKDISGMKVGYCIPDTSESFLSNLSNTVKEKFAADGITVEIANAAGDSITQISQIENFTTAGTDLIIIMSVDPTGVTDAIKRAQEAGVKVLVAGGDTGAYDALMYTEQFEDGKMMAEMGAEWVEKTFPDAAAGSIEVAILEDRSTPEASSRCDGMQTISEITDKVKVVQTVGSVKSNDAAQAAMGNVLQSNPDIKLVLNYNSSAAIGTNEYVMRDGSGITDKSQFAVFCSDFDPNAATLIADSATNASVLRGLIKFGSNDLAGDTYNLAKKMLAGETYEAKNPDPLTKISVDNIADFQ